MENTCYICDTEMVKKKMPIKTGGGKCKFTIEGMSAYECPNCGVEEGYRYSFETSERIDECCHCPCFIMSYNDKGKEKMRCHITLRIIKNCDKRQKWCPLTDECVFKK